MDYNINNNDMQTLNITNLEISQMHNVKRQGYRIRAI